MKNNKKLLSLLLAVVMVISLSVTAFASWNQFQSNSSNNGLISSSNVPVETPALTEAVELTHADDWTADSGLPGMDSTPIVVGDTAYVLYYGGSSDDDNGGVRISAVSLSDTPEEVWSTKVSGDLDVDNISQLGTPYYDETKQTIYAPVTYSQNVFAGKTVTADSNGGSIDSNGRISLPAGTTTCTFTINNVVIDGSSKMTYVPTGITVQAGQNISGEVSFTSVSSSSSSYAFGTSFGYEGYEFCLYNQTGDTVPAGTYTVKVTLRSNVACTGTGSLRSVTPYWRLYMLRAFSNASSIALPAQTSDASYVEGAGQFNTPITGTTYNGHKYLYFGIYDGDRAYYQYDFTTAAQSSLKSFYYFRNGEGFYWAGAAVVGDSVYFGGEGGYVFKRPIGDTFGSATNTYLYLSGDRGNAGGAIRSSISYKDGYLYLTTKGGYLWKFEPSLSDSTARWCKLTDNDFIVNASSTPVISDSGYVYAGGYNIAWNADGSSTYKGALKAVNTNTWTTSDVTPITLWSAASNGAIQSSPVVYYDEDSEVDYVYFTTNGAAGQARCVAYSEEHGVSGGWQVNSGTYTLQGLAVSDNGYMAFGNDNNMVFVLK